MELVQQNSKNLYHWKEISHRRGFHSIEYNTIFKQQEQANILTYLVADLICIFFNNTRRIFHIDQIDNPSNYPQRNRILQLVHVSIEVCSWNSLVYSKLKFYHCANQAHEQRICKKSGFTRQDNTETNAPGRIVLFGRIFPERIVAAAVFLFFSAQSVQQGVCGSAFTGPAKALSNDIFVSLESMILISTAARSSTPEDFIQNPLEP